MLGLFFADFATCIGAIFKAEIGHLVTKYIYWVYFSLYEKFSFVDCEFRWMNLRFFIKRRDAAFTCLRTPSAWRGRAWRLYIQRFACRGAQPAMAGRLRVCGSCRASRQK